MRSSPNRTIFCRDIIVDIPAIPRIQIDLKRRHDRIGIAEIDHIDRPLGNHFAEIQPVLFVRRAIVIEIVPVGYWRPLPGHRHCGRHVRC